MLTRNQTQCSSPSIHKFSGIRNPSRWKSISPPCPNFLHEAVRFAGSGNLVDMDRGIEGAPAPDLHPIGLPFCSGGKFSGIRNRAHTIDRDMSASSPPPRRVGPPSSPRSEGAEGMRPWHVVAPNTTKEGRDGTGRDIA